MALLNCTRMPRLTRVLPSSSTQHTRKMMHPVGLGHAVEDVCVLVGLLVLEEGDEILGHLVDGLVELGLAGVASAQAGHELLEIALSVSLRRLRHGRSPGGMRERPPAAPAARQSLAGRSRRCHRRGEPGKARSPVSRRLRSSRGAPGNRLGGRSGRGRRRQGGYHAESPRRPNAGPRPPEAVGPRMADRRQTHTSTRARQETDPCPEKQSSSKAFAPD